MQIYKMALTQPFDLQNLLINSLAGNEIIFVILATIVISGMAAKFKMNNYAFAMIISLFAIMVATIAPWYLFLVVLLGGFMIYYSIGRLIRT